MKMRTFWGKNNERKTQFPQPRKRGNHVQRDGTHGQDQ
jgi:hypothetical protein